MLYASPCTSQAGSADLALRLPARDEGDDRIRIGMVHGRTFHAEGYQTNFPVDPEAAKRAGRIVHLQKGRLVDADAPPAEARA